MTPTRSPLLLSAGLLAVVGAAGCQNQKCHQCQSSYDTIHVMPYDSYPYSYEVYPAPVQYGTPTQEYVQPTPVQPREAEPVPVSPVEPESKFPPAPKPDQDDATPPEPPDSTSYRSNGGYQLQSMSPRAQFEQRRVIQRPQPRVKTEARPAEQSRGLLPRRINPPRMLKPTGSKMRSMFEAVKDRMPKGRMSSNTTVKNRPQKRNSRGHAAAKIAKRTRPAQQPAPQVKTPTVLLMKPQYLTKRTINDSQLIQPKSRPIAQTRMTQFAPMRRPQPTQQQSWQTRIPREVSGPTFGSTQSTPMRRANTNGQYQQWPYAKSFAN